MARKDSTFDLSKCTWLHPTTSSKVTNMYFKLHLQNWIITVHFT